jgi:hypothetical protein
MTTFWPAGSFGCTSLCSSRAASNQLADAVELMGETPESLSDDAGFGVLASILISGSIVSWHSRSISEMILEESDFVLHVNDAIKSEIKAEDNQSAEI